MIRILRRQPESTELEEIATVTDGDVKGADLSDLFVDGPPSEQELVERFDGPHLFAVGMGQAEGQDGGPLAHVPNVPDNPDTLTRPMIQEIVRWKAGQLSEEMDNVTVNVGQQYDEEGGGDAQAAKVQAGEFFDRHFNPSLHPRDPETGQFVERPFDFDLDQQTLDNTPTPDLLQFLSDNGEPVDQWVAGDQMSIDGIPDDAESLDDARRILREEGTLPEDLTPDDLKNDFPDAVGDRMPKPERRDLEPGETVILERNGETVGMGEVIENDGAKLTVEEEDGTVNNYPVSNTITRPVDMTEVPSQEERELGVRPGDFDTSPSDDFTATSIPESDLSEPLTDQQLIDEGDEPNPLSTGELVVYDGDDGQELGQVTDMESGVLYVQQADGSSDKFIGEQANARRVDPGGRVSPDAFEQRIDDAAAENTDFGGKAQVSDEARNIAQDVVEMVDDVGSAPSLSSDAAWSTREGARAGSSPSSTGDMEAESFPQLRNQASKALQQAIRRHDDVSNQAAKQVLGDLDRMKGKSYSDAGKTFENGVQERLDLPGDLRNDDKSIKATGDNPEYNHASEVVTAVSQEIYRELHGDERELHRGLQTTGGAQLVNGLLQSDPDGDNTFTFSENVIANYSTAENVAQDFARSAWVTRQANPDDVAHASDDLLGERSSFRGEGEIALSTGETEVPYDAVKVKSSAGDEPISVGQIFDKDPDELGLAEMNNVNDLLQYLNQRDVPVPDQSDVPDSMQDWLESWTERQADNMVVGMHSDTRSVLRQVLGNDRFEEARKGSE